MRRTQVPGMAVKCLLSVQWLHILLQALKESLKEAVVRGGLERQSGQERPLGERLKGRKGVGCVERARRGV
jgi:hypothetical protein